jgi:hypothetical protein
MGGQRQDIQAILETRGLGNRVIRPAAADPQNAWLTIFVVRGGLVMITSLIGVRTVVQAGGASTMQFRHSVGPTVLDAGTLAVTAQAAGAIYFLTGDVADAIVAGVAGAPVMSGKLVATATAYAGGFGIGVIAGAGNIQVTMTAGAGTGSTRYVLHYIAIDEGATVGVG